MKDPSSNDRSHRAPLSESTLELGETSVLGAATSVESSSPSGLDRGEPWAAHRLAPGARIHRYRIVEPLGAGGMGVVYRARDTVLDREVALKLLHVTAHNPLAAEKARKRLKREAQALAQLPHPNVVQVYDVDIWGESVYIAMEFVEGQTLRYWLVERAGRERADAGGEPGRPEDDDPVRSLDEILDVFMDAGRGLAAAHRIGLVHRDFKLDNVMVGSDGRVRILDFGLARASARERGSLGLLQETRPPSGERAPTPPPEPPPYGSSQPGTDRRSLLDAPLTAHGAVVGTPAFMAPEQYLGEEVDARADQFSFCVSLYRAVYRCRPFEGRSVTELRTNILGGKMVEAPPDAAVPRWLVGVIGRGLSLDPEERYPSMDELLVELERHRSRSGRPVTMWFAPAALVALVALVLGVSFGGRDEVVLCQGGEERVHEIWNQGRKRAVRAAFAATGRAHAARTGERVERILDDYGRDWAALHTEVCEATHVREQQSAEELDLRMSCLARHRRAMQRLIEIFVGKPGGAVVDEAITAALRLPPVERCAGDEALRSGAVQPAEGKAQERVAALGDELDGLETRVNIGQGHEVLARLEALAAKAEELAFPPLEARAHFLLASVQYDTGAVEDAEGGLTTAAQAAARAGDDELLAQVWTRMILVVGYGQGRHSEAFALRSAAESALERAGNDPLLRAEMLSNIGVLQDRIGKHDEAEKLAREALSLATQALGERHPELRTYLRRLGVALSQQRKYQEALRYHRRELELIEHHFGPDHVFLAAPLLNIGRCIDRERQSDEALAYLRRALELEEENHGPVSRNVGIILLNMGSWLGQRGRYREAQEAFERARANNIEVFGPENPMVAHVLYGLGQSLLDQGRLEPALEAAEQALAIHERASGKEHPDVARAALLAGHIASARADHEQAEAYIRRALDIHEQAGGRDHRSTGKALTALGRAFTRAGRYDAAALHLERGLAILDEARGSSDGDVADALHAGVALWLRQGDLERAEAAIARVRSLREQALGSGHPKLAETELDAAELDLARGRVEAALSRLESARGVLEEFPVDPLVLARAKLLQARALTATGDRGQAARLAREARAALRQLGPRAEPLLEQADARRRRRR